MRRLLQLILLVRCAGEHSSSRSLLMPALEQCKLRRELEPHPEAKNNLLTNVLIHEHDLNVSLRMYIMPPLRVRLEVVQKRLVAPFADGLVDSQPCSGRVHPFPMLLIRLALLPMRVAADVGRNL